MVSKASAPFTDRERELMSLAFQNLKTAPEIDYEKMAVAAGLKGAKSARDSFRPILKKLMAGSPTAVVGKTEGADGEEEAEVALPKGGKKGTARKRKIAAAEEEGGETGGKRARSRKAGAGAVEEAEEEDALEVKAEDVED